MSSKIPWPRVFVEGVVIVGSILLAFGIDAWWDGRQALEAERGLIAAVIEETNANKRLVEDVIASVENDYRSFRRFYRLADNEMRRVERDTVFVILRSMWRPNTHELHTGALSSALQPEGIHAGPLRDLLSDLQSQIEALDEQLRQLGTLEERGLLAVGRHDAFQVTLLAEREAAGATVDLRDIRDDAEVLAAATAMAYKRILYMGELQLLLAQLTTVAERLDGSVEAEEGA